MSGGLWTSPHFEKRRSTWTEEEGTPLRDLVENLDVYPFHPQTIINTLLKSLSAGAGRQGLYLRDGQAPCTESRAPRAQLTQPRFLERKPESTQMLTTSGQSPERLVTGVVVV